MEPVRRWDRVERWGLVKRWDKVGKWGGPKGIGAERCGLVRG